MPRTRYSLVKGAVNSRCEWHLLKRIADMTESGGKIAVVWKRASAKVAKELNRQNLLLELADRRNFTTPKCDGVPQVLFTGLRCFLALYCTAWCIGGIMKTSGHPFISQYGIIGQFITTFFFIFAAVLTEIAYFKPFMAFSSIREEMKANETLRYRRKITQTSQIFDNAVQTNSGTMEDVPMEYLSMSQDYVNARESVVLERRNKKHSTTRWYHKMLWLLYYWASNMTWISFFMSMLLKSNFLYSGDGVLIAFNVHTYIMFPIFLFVDLMLNSIPVQLIHVVYPLAWNTGFLFIAGIIHSIRGTPLALVPHLDCQKNNCIAVAILFCILGTALIHLMLYCLTKAKSRLLFRRRTLTFSDNEAYTNPNCIYSDFSLNGQFTSSKRPSLGEEAHTCVNVLYSET